MGMFDNYKKDSTDIPGNIYRYVITEEENYIIVGASCFNTFKLLVKYDADLITNVSVTYYQCERMSLTKEIASNSNEVDVRPGLEIIPLKDSFIVRCNLFPEETKLFKDTNLDTFAQVKITYGNRVLIGEKIKVEVINTVEEKTK